MGIGDRPSAPGRGGWMMMPSAKPEGSCAANKGAAQAGVFIDVCSVTSLLPSSDLIVLVPPHPLLLFSLAPV